MTEANSVCGKACACHSHLINRRDFLTLTGAATLAMTLGSLPVMAGPFEDADFAALVPPDKKLRPEWVRSLFAPGSPTVYTKKRDELRFIGMPVGGICCGTVYLGGDGRLWVWDIFNEVHEGFLPGQSGARNGANYVSPPTEHSPLDQGFALKIGDTVRRLDGTGWQDITFQGEYPLGKVRYADLASPVSVTLTAYSPFIPLNADDSGLPAVLCEWTLENVSSKAIDAEIGGWLQNAVRLSSGAVVSGERVNTVQMSPGMTILNCTYADALAAETPRPDVVMENFQHADYGRWKVEGTAFGEGPILRGGVPSYQGDLGGVGDRVVNSHASAPGDTIEDKDAQTGALTSPPFTIERKYLMFDIGGGGNVEEVGLALIVGGKAVCRAAGRDANRMHTASFSIAEFMGKEGVIQIYDRATGIWGNIGVGTIIQTDVLPASHSDVPDAKTPRPDVVVEDFQHADYGRWKVEGTAFGKGPILRVGVPPYQGDLGGVGDRVVNSHASAPGGTISEKDAQTGALTSPPFTIERKYLTFDIGGGGNVEEVGLALIVGGKAVCRAAGRGENRMHTASFSIAEFMGKEGVIQIYDRATGAWGNIGVGTIIQTDVLPASHTDVPAADMGTMSLLLLEAGVGRPAADSDTLFASPAADTARAASGEKLVGAITHAVHLAPGESRTVTFVLTWHFPNGRIAVDGGRNYYAKRFADAGAVAEYVAQNHTRLTRDTKLWHQTWYDSTLPHWFLDRTFANTSILATSTAHRLSTGRFWGWEGVGCCEGTCTHVYHYAQAIGRIFPELERYTREHVDFGTALHPDGAIGYRGEGTGPAVDGQCGRILGAYREHQMSANGAFLHRIWPNVRRAMEFLIRHDANGDGLLDGPQDNTLDGTWYGKIPWISSLYAAALRACEEMAADVGDAAFAAACRQKFLVSKNAIESQLFDKDYFVQLPEPGHEDSLGSYKGCHIDQVHGQSWAWQLGLGRILDQNKTVTALQSLYKYNFSPDVGPFRAKNTLGRPYALAGDGGLIMVTNPRGLPNPFGVHSWQFGYFNECMSGFEHQAASHMIAEGLVLEGLAVTRAIHDRYHASRRNPFNEIECSDHYARAMASYGSFVTICGFEYHGPHGHLGFSPRISPEHFRAPFTAAEGWGTFSQEVTGKTMEAHVAVKHGGLRLSTLTLSPPPGAENGRVVVTLGGRHLAATHAVNKEGRLRLTLAHPLLLVAGQTLTAKIGSVS